jgi:hypothetical protein
MALTKMQQAGRKRLIAKTVFVLTVLTAVIVFISCWWFLSKFGAKLFS